MQLSLIPEPESAPTLPGPGLAQVALRMLMTGQSMTTPDFQAVTGSWRLAAYVRELRALGWPVLSHEVSRPIPENPNRHVATYWLSDDDIQKNARVMAGGMTASLRSSQGGGAKNTTGGEYGV